MIDWLLYQIPWWAYALLAAIVIATLQQLVGLKNALVAAGLAAAAVFNVRSRQQGWKDREAKGQRDAAEIIERADGARRDADRRNADPDGLYADDGHRRD